MTAVEEGVYRYRSAKKTALSPSKYSPPKRYRSVPCGQLVSVALARLLGAWATFSSVVRCSDCHASVKLLRSASRSSSSSIVFPLAFPFPFVPVCAFPWLCPLLAAAFFVSSFAALDSCFARLAAFCAALLAPTSPFPFFPIKSEAQSRKKARSSTQARKFVVNTHATGPSARDMLGAQGRTCSPVRGRCS